MLEKDFPIVGNSIPIVNKQIGSPTLKVIGYFRLGHHTHTHTHTHIYSMHNASTQSEMEKQKYPQPEGMAQAKYSKGNHNLEKL